MVTPGTSYYAKTAADQGRHLSRGRLARIPAPIGCATIGATEPPSKKTMPMPDIFLKTSIFLAPFHALGENPLLGIERDMEFLIHLGQLNAPLQHGIS